MIKPISQNFAFDSDLILWFYKEKSIVQDIDYILYKVVQKEYNQYYSILDCVVCF